MFHKLFLLKMTMFTGVVFLLVTQFCGSAHAAYKIGDEERYLNIGGLLQVHALLNQDGAPDGDSLGKELYVRRMRLMVYGQINKWVNFFVETDNPNFGKGGNLSMNTFIQDAYLELNLHSMFQLDMGMLLVPFSHHGMQGATSLLGLDYHGAIVKYPAGSTKVWRDFGVMARGMFTKWVEYRLGVFNGVHGNATPVAVVDDNKQEYSYMTDPRNDSDALRMTARLTLNIFEPEGGAGVGGMFYDGIYIKHTENGVVSTKKVLSIGGSFDFQPDVNVTLGDISGGIQEYNRSAYMATAADVFWDIPMGANNIMSLNGQVNFYYYDYGDLADSDNYLNVVGAGSSYSGIGISSEIGFRYDAFQPLVLFDMFQAKDAWDGTAVNEDLGDYMGIHGGFNYWMFGHSASFKLQAGAVKVNGGDYGASVALQGQLLF